MRWVVLEDEGGAGEKGRPREEESFVATDEESFVVASFSESGNLSNSSPTDLACSTVGAGREESSKGNPGETKCGDPSANSISNAFPPFLPLPSSSA